MERDSVRQLAKMTAEELVWQGQTRREFKFDHTQITDLLQGDTVEVVITKNRQSVKVEPNCWLETTLNVVIPA